MRLTKLRIALFGLTLVALVGVPTALMAQTPEPEGSILDKFNTVVPCPDNPDFQCATMLAPLDYANPGNGNILELTFAIHPAEGERKGMYVQAFPGGPGGIGIEDASLLYFNEDIIENFDIAFFDQRGIGMSSPLECDGPLTEFKNLRYPQTGGPGYDTPQEVSFWDAAVQKFVSDCVAELGSAEDLVFYSTEYVALDLELFRQVAGDDQFWLYGVSYGTTVAQEYARRYPEHLAGLILDGTADPRTNGEEYLYSQLDAFDLVRDTILETCNADPLCAADFDGDAVAFYNQLESDLTAAPIIVDYPLANGQTTQRTFTANNLSDTVINSLYFFSARTLLVRALAHAYHGNFVPLLQLQYFWDDIDPETDQFVLDPTFSTLMYYGVNCADQSYFTGTPEERVAAAIEQSLDNDDNLPRFNDFSTLEGMICAYWPSSPATDEEPSLITAEGVPTLVLNATLDPATPFAEGEAVFQNLDDGYHIYVEGGIHSIYGLGFECPDAIVSNFLVNDVVPSSRVTVCDWGEDSIWSPYAPVAPAHASVFTDPLEALDSFYLELASVPQVRFSSFEEPVSIGCRIGGSMSIGLSPGGFLIFAFNQCAFSEGFNVTGTGSIETGNPVLELTLTGDASGEVIYTRDRNIGINSVVGTYNGEAVDIAR